MKSVDISLLSKLQRAKRTLSLWPYSKLMTSPSKLLTRKVLLIFFGGFLEKTIFIHVEKNFNQISTYPFDGDYQALLAYYLVWQHMFLCLSVILLSQFVVSVNIFFPSALILDSLGGALVCGNLLSSLLLILGDHCFLEKLLATCWETYSYFHSVWLAKHFFYIIMF